VCLANKCFNDGKFFGIKKVKDGKQLPLNAQGYLGLAPPTSDEKRFNFLSQLKDAGVVDHEVLGMKVNLMNSTKSVLRFGGYHESLIDNKTDITYFDTITL